MTRPTKRAKTGDHEASAETANEPSSAKNPLSILRPDLLSDESVASLKAAFSGSLPYEHVVLTSPFDPNVLESVRQEIINNVQATYKETDLFKMFQTGDLANLDALPADQAAKLKTARLLRDALYSVEFRFFISKILGCGPLTDKTDCACNVHTEGGHLLCHDDVIGTRRVSYIIYLTDPEEGWTKEDGGALELYPSSEGELKRGGCERVGLGLTAVFVFVGSEYLMFVICGSFFLFELSDWGHRLATRISLFLNSRCRWGRLSGACQRDSANLFGFIVTKLPKRDVDLGLYRRRGSCEPSTRLLARVVPMGLVVDTDRSFFEIQFGT